MEMGDAYSYKVDTEKRVLASLLIPLYNINVKKGQRPIRSVNVYVGSPPKSFKKNKGKTVYAKFGTPEFKENYIKHFSEKKYKKLEEKHGNSS